MESEVSVKKTMWILLSMLAFAFNANAANEIGNGGGLWICRSNSNQAVTSAMLVDLFEARSEFKLGIPVPQSGLAAQQILELKLGWLATNYPQLLNLIEPYIDLVESNIVYVDGQLQIVDDSLYRLKPGPETCANGRVEYVQFANFTNYGKLLVQLDLWNSKAITELDRAALLFHEIVYRALRDSGDRNSIRARQIVGLVFSDLSAQEMRKRVRLVLNGSEIPPRTVPPRTEPPRRPLDDAFKPGAEVPLNEFGARLLVVSGNSKVGWTMQLSWSDGYGFREPVIFQMKESVSPSVWLGQIDIPYYLHRTEKCGVYSGKVQMKFDSRPEALVIFTRFFSWPRLVGTSSHLGCRDVDSRVWDGQGVLQWDR
jgi:hypothetical protein